MKKLLLSVLAIVLMVSFFTVPSYGLEAAQQPRTAPVTAPKTLEEFQQNATALHNIQYASGTNLFVLATAMPGLLAKDGSPLVVDATQFYIDLTTERLYTKLNPTAAASKNIIPTHFNVDGGKYVAISFTQDPLNKDRYFMDFAKVLDKGGAIKLITIYDATAKAPQKYIAYVAADKEAGTEEVAGADGSTTYEFPKIGARNAFEKVVLDYYTCRSVTGDGTGSWIPETGADKYNIALTEDGKTPSDAGWGTIDVIADNGKWDDTYGVFVQPLDSGKQVKAIYLVRSKPTFSTEGGTYAAASKAKKLSVAGLAKAPGFKIDYKKEVIKAKTNATVMAGSTTTINKVTYDAFEVIQNDTFGVKGEGSTTHNQAAVLTADKAKELKLVTTEYSYDEATGKFKNEDSLYGQTIGIRIGVDSTKKNKPASAIQKITIADRAKIYAKDFAPVAEKGKLTLAKTYEVYSKDKQKWGSTPKLSGAADLKVRIKNAAKYDAKTDTTTGDIASLPMTITTSWGAFDEKKPDKKGTIGFTVKEYPWYDGLVTFMLMPNSSDDATDGQLATVTKTPEEWTGAAPVIKFYMQTPDKGLYIPAKGTTPASQTDFKYADLGLTAEVKGSGTAYTTTATIEPASNSSLAPVEGKENVYLVSVALEKGAAFKTVPYTVTLKPTTTNAETKPHYSWDKFIIPTVTIICEQPAYTPTFAENDKYSLTIKNPAKALSTVQAASITSVASYTEITDIAKESLPIITVKPTENSSELAIDFVLDAADIELKYSIVGSARIAEGLLKIKDEKGNVYIFVVKIDVPVKYYTPKLKAHSEVTFTVKNGARALNQTDAAKISSRDKYAEILQVNASELPVIFVTKKTGESVFDYAIKLEDSDVSLGYSVEVDSNANIVKFKDSDNNFYIYIITVNPFSTAKIDDRTIAEVSSGSGPLGYIKIKLKDATFKRINPGVDINEWFSNLPNNISAQTSTLVAEGAAEVSILLYRQDTLPITSKTVIACSIPVDFLQQKGNNVTDKLVCTPNPNATIEIKQN